MDEGGSVRTIWSSPGFSRRSTQQQTDTTMSFEFGASDILEMSRPTPLRSRFDAATDHKIDSRAAGRYLSYKVTISHDGDFRFSASTST